MPRLLTTIDWIIVGFTLLMAVWGYTQGLIVGGLSLGGFAGGAVLGSRLGPLVLDEGAKSPYAPLFALTGALLLGGLLASVFEALGFRLRGGLGERVGVADGLGGAVFVACIGLGLVWIAGAVALQTPGVRELRRDVQRSHILRTLNARLPPSGPILNALARFDPIPEIRGPSPRVGPPDSRIARDRDVLAAGRSVVRVLGTACGLAVQGSGWIAGEGVVVTNAHVVAGQDDTTIQVQGRGAAHAAEAIWFDARNDLAILRAPGARGVPSLPLDSDPAAGTSGAIAGFPGNGPYDVEPGRLGATSTVVSFDAYGRGPVRRSVTSLRGRVRSGNSGGPMVDGRGRVVTTIFAAASGARTGYGVPARVIRDALRSAGGSTGTGPCAR